MIALFASSLSGGTGRLREIPGHSYTPEVQAGVLALILAALPDDDGPQSRGALLRRLEAEGVPVPVPYPMPATLGSD